MKAPIARYLLVFLMLSLFGISVAQARSLPDFTDLVEENSAAVVNISTTLKGPENKMPPGMRNLPQIPEDSPFYDFFRKFLEEQPDGGGQPYEDNSLGSGFIISKDGYVITNNHVVKDAREVVVRLVDRREFVAEVIGTDPRSDLAVLKIDGENLPTLKLGDSSKLKVGEWVLAIGSPFGFDHSVTAGIVSAKGRSLPKENYVPFIQTDVAINPGNSGGPLFNLDGEVVGVNSQIYSRTGGFMGLSFAVPINVVESVYQQLRDKGRVSRGWLGVLIQDVTRELAESFDMKRPHGALVARVLPDSPAAKAGVEVGDIIVNYDGEDIADSSDLPPMVGSTHVGSEVEVEIIREGNEKRLNLTIEELPDDDQTLANRGKPDKPDAANQLDISVRDLTESQREELELPENGVLVEEVGPGPGRAAGIRSGDILLMLNNTKVKNAEHFAELVGDLPTGKSVPVLVQRRGGPMFLAIKIDPE
ncbi:serine protease Do [Methylohalomonas lacus]|uniref:Probable periplasmic serine endoprotease DegP-like n=1 Tax=Methylohalomonas lacus TaxID=398773 RepID=A0AAE3HIT9_9GAMM|nr:DegQ family serine endoprotease [Methylohalomonas lacus]MCS3902615.1 serine protease Do [Methylohalomonas lacus]